MAVAVKDQPDPVAADAVHNSNDAPGSKAGRSSNTIWRFSAMLPASGKAGLKWHCKNSNWASTLAAFFGGVEPSRC